MEILKVAINELGQKEIKGSKHNQRILQYAKEAGFEYVNDDETPWCSIFVAWCSMKCGLERSSKPSARSWLNIGVESQNPTPGDVVVFYRGDKNGWQGHVAIFMGYAKDPNFIFALGGNQGDSVSIAKFQSSKILGFRRISSQVVYDLPSIVLSKGDEKQEVKNLQFILNSKGYDCGYPDGIFGNKTMAVIKEIQLKAGFEVTGVYDKRTSNHIHDLIAE